MKGSKKPEVRLRKIAELAEEGRTTRDLVEAMALVHPKGRIIAIMVNLYGFLDEEVEGAWIDWYVRTTTGKEARKRLPHWREFCWARNAKAPGEVQPEEEPRSWGLETGLEGIRIKGSTRPECRRRMFIVLAELGHTMVDWVRYLAVTKGLDKEQIVAHMVGRGFLDEEAEGAWIDYRSGIKYGE